MSIKSLNKNSILGYKNRLIIPLQQVFFCYKYIMEEKFIIKEFHKKYPNSHACLEEISKLRWPRGIFCIKCNKITKFYHVKKEHPMHVNFVEYISIHLQQLFLRNLLRH